MCVVSTSGLREFKLSELEAATSNFSHDNIIGQGGHSIVFKVCIWINLLWHYLQCETIWIKMLDFLWFCTAVDCLAILHSMMCLLFALAIIEFSCGEYYLLRFSWFWLKTQNITTELRYLCFRFTFYIYLIVILVSSFYKMIF